MFPYVLFLQFSHALHLEHIECSGKHLNKGAKVLLVFPKGQGVVDFLIVESIFVTITLESGQFEVIHLHPP